jgi:transcriptional regulator with XRE-family HTH domain
LTVVNRGLTVQFAEIIQQAKIGAGTTTDGGLARALKVTKQSVSNWRRGISLPDTVTCEKLAVFSGIPLHRVLGVVGEQRAISQEEKRVWRKLAGAALLAGIMLTSAAPVWAKDAVCTLCSWLRKVTMRVTFRSARTANIRAGNLLPAWTSPTLGQVGASPGDT